MTQSAPTPMSGAAQALSPPSETTALGKEAEMSGLIGSADLTRYIERPSQAWNSWNIIMVGSTVGIMMCFFLTIALFPLWGPIAFIFVPVGIFGFMGLSTAINSIWQAMVVKNVAMHQILRGIFWKEEETFMDVDIILHKTRVVTMEEEEYTEFLTKAEKDSQGTIHQRFRAAGLERMEDGADVTVLECWTDNIFRKEYYEDKVLFDEKGKPVDEEGNKIDPGPKFGKFYIIIPDNEKNLERYMKPSVGDVYVQNIWLEIQRSVCQFTIMGSFGGIPRVLLTFGGGRVIESVKLARRAMAAAVRDISQDLIEERIKCKWHEALNVRLYDLLQKILKHLPRHDKYVMEALVALLHFPKDGAREIIESGESKEKERLTVASWKGAVLMGLVGVAAVILFYLILVTVGII